jgi:hypothetical protein
LLARLPLGSMSAWRNSQANVDDPDKIKWLKICMGWW